MLAPPEDNVPQDPTVLRVAAAIIPNANIGTHMSRADSTVVESVAPLPSLVACQGGDQIPHVWLNGEFCKQLWTQTESETTEGPLDSLEDDVSDLEPVSSGSEAEEPQLHGYLAFRFSHP